MILKTWNLKEIFPKMVQVMMVQVIQEGDQADHKEVRTMMKLNKDGDHLLTIIILTTEFHKSLIQEIRSANM